MFQLGDNANPTATSFTEPDTQAIFLMVFKWLDLALEQAKMLKMIKRIILYPLFKHIERSTDGHKKKGDFAKLQQYLSTLSDSLYIFG